MLYEHAYKVVFLLFTYLFLQTVDKTVPDLCFCKLCLCCYIQTSEVVNFCVILFKVWDITELYNKSFLKYFFSVTTFVFHGIELQKAFNQKRLILCCSLTDEAWILNLLYQMTNFTEPYRITTWIKSIGISFPFSANTVVALISPNSSKCEQFNRYINYFTHTTLCVVEIAPTERPSFSRFVDCYMYATSMTFKELADKILSSAESKLTWNTLIIFNINLRKIMFVNGPKRLFLIFCVNSRKVSGNSAPLFFRLSVKLSQIWLQHINAHKHV